jgi:hypothetical protein
MTAEDWKFLIAGVSVLLAWMSYKQWKGRKEEHHYSSAL